MTVLSVFHDGDGGTTVFNVTSCPFVDESHTGNPQRGSMGNISWLGNIHEKPNIEAAFAA